MKPLINSLWLLCIVPALAAAQPAELSRHTDDSVNKQGQTVPSPTAPGRALPIDLAALPVIDDVDLLAIDAPIQELLDRSLGHIRQKYDLTFALHDLLYSRNFLGIGYDNTATRSAQETFNSRQGNCLALASLYVAAARHVGLKARFQSVDIPLDWVPGDDLYVLASHINVGVHVPGNRLTVELTDAYSPERTRLLKTRPLSDTEALAEFYNNRGMEQFQRGQLHTALAYLLKAVETDRKASHIWSNLGVLYKRAGHRDLALESYERARKLNPQNSSALTNIYVLYREEGDSANAEKIVAKVIKNSRKNPYILSHLAKSSVKLGRYDEAVRLLKRAMHLKADEAAFHFELALVYLQTNDLVKSRNEMAAARDTAANEVESDRYRQKLQALERL